MYQILIKLGTHPNKKGPDQYEIIVWKWLKQMGAIEIEFVGH